MPPAADRQRRVKTSDERLIEALLRGDRALANEVHSRLLRTVDATLYRLLGRRDSDYDDLVQTSLEQIMVSLGRGKFAGGATLATWASGVTCNVALRAIRRRRLERRIFDRSFDVETRALSRPGSVNLEAQLIARHHLKWFHKQLVRMSVKLSEALLLHDVLGFGLSETASMTGATQSAVRSRLVRGRRQLSQRLRQDVEVRARGSRRNA